MSIRIAIQRELDSPIPLEIRPETRMAGNQEGLGLIDAKDLQLRSIQQHMDNVHAPELLKYLPSGIKRPDTYKRNELVHAGNVIFDLDFLRRVDSVFLVENKVQRHDLLAAFRNRYGDDPEAFQGYLPAEVERIINLKSSLTHLWTWKDLKRPGDNEHISKRDALINMCDTAIRRWFQRTTHPYSMDEVASTFADIRNRYDIERECIEKESKSLGKFQRLRNKVRGLKRFKK
ncbi:uncharacterized protein TRUGW13939_00558 [Talaromyces rugulosus]|uniref:Uncharacterized protein n=1 Tax=Talaromyces rugulosus TaxID=121627 RepID=A0A7H8QHM3_TALRU|nr:uncharacterized protein TRUGW13939_00558 [Talaromyces rugulosus]QKX53479.1 hypothetical protein TRUGW13939_00558 [Talaromyces rugulosus]